MSDYSKLKELAEAASEGAWVQDAFEVVSDGIEDRRVARCSWLTDAQYIAAANPVVVLGLIAENERLTNRLEVDPRHDYDGISTRDATVKVLDEQVDQLKAENEALRKDAERWRFFSVLANDLQAFPHAWGKMTPEKMDAMCDLAMADAAMGKGGESNECS